MPLFYHRQLTPKGELGIWKIEESEDYFASRLALSSKEREQLAAMKGARRVQWFAVRQLVHIMSGREKEAPLSKMSLVNLAWNTLPLTSLSAIRGNMQQQ